MISCIFEYGKSFFSSDLCAGKVSISLPVYIYPWEFDWTTKMKDVEVDEYGLKMGQAKDKIFLPYKF